MDYEKILSKRVQELKPSGIRKFFDIAANMKDVISLSIGEPDFKTPWEVRAAAIETLEKGRTTYTANSGLAALRVEITRYMERKFGLSYHPEDETLVTVGGSEAIDLCIRAFVEPGDEVLVVEPCFVAYAPIIEMMRGVPVPVETVAEESFRLTAARLREKITEKTKLLVLPYPNNPTGGVMRKEHLEEIAEVLRGTNIMVLSDEIYAELTYGGLKHTSFAAIDGMRERTILLNGFSKAFAMTGVRPVLSECAACGNPVTPLPDGSLAFSPREGGVICSHCRVHTEAGYIDAQTAEWSNFLLRSTFSDIAGARMGVREAFSVLDLCQRWCLEHVGCRLRSLSFMFTSGLYESK